MNDQRFNGGVVVFFLLIVTASRVDGWLHWVGIAFAIVVFALCSRRAYRLLRARR